MKPRPQTVIKGSSLPVLRIVVRDGDSQSLHTELMETIESARPMLAEGIAVLDLRERQSSDVDPGEIFNMVRDARIRLAAVLINEPDEREALADLDLPVIEVPLSARDRQAFLALEDQVTTTASDQATSAASDPAASAASDPAASAASDPAASAASDRAASTASDQVTATASEPAPVEQTTEQPAPLTRADQATEEPTSSGVAPLYLTRPLRSGQRFYAQGRDAVVAARTSRGSEVIADGSIYAFSPLRGRVLAGASGDTNACIVASHLDAELVSVAGVYRTFEPDELSAHGSGPVSVTLSVDADGNEQLTLAALAHTSSIQRQ